MTIQQLQDAFSIYIEEIDRCEQAKCYWSLLHVLLAIPDVCASLENKYNEVGDRYVNWCNAYIHKNSNISSSDIFQMRNSLFHSGSSTVINKGKKYQSNYAHFSFVDPDYFDITFHNSVDTSSNILNIHIKVLVTEIKQALDNWFISLQKDPSTMAIVESNINFLSHSKQKQIDIKELDGSASTIKGITKSST